MKTTDRISFCAKQLANVSNIIAETSQSISDENSVDGLSEMLFINQIEQAQQLILALTEMITSSIGIEDNTAQEDVSTYASGTIPEA